MVENKGMKAESVQELEQMKEVCSQGLELKPWNEMTWEDVYAELGFVVERAFKEDEGINYLPKMYYSQTIERVKLRCVDGLEDLIFTFRGEYPKAIEPIDFDWPLFLWHRDNKQAIKKRLDSDLDLKKAMGKYHEMYTGNISICIAKHYNTLINDRNCATLSR
jgi:hypothetical protein